MAGLRVVLFLLFLCLLSVVAAGDSKNDIKKPSTKFRSMKANQVWEKANRMKLPALTLTDLYSDLKHFDEMLLEHKRNRKQDEDGTRDAELHEQFFEILSKYGLDGKKRLTPEEMKQLNMNHRFIDDPKLDKLWQHVQKNGKFSKDELDELETEFHHHRRKVEELRILKDEFESVHELSDNSVEKQMKIVEQREKSQKISELHGDIEEGYQRLNLKTKQGVLSEEAVPFTEPRVAKLWEEALQGNFSEAELKSIKEELTHFQTKVQKHVFFREQLNNSMEKIKHQGGEETASQQHLDSRNHLQNKVQDLGVKVKKLHYQLTKKLSSGDKVHREL